MTDLTSNTQNKLPKSFQTKRWVVIALVMIAVGAAFVRTADAINQLSQSEAAAFLALPLSVFLPALALLFLATRGEMLSQEGALMQLGSIVQLLLIIMLPSFALYLALGFPFVFLVVELFETRLPAVLRDRIKALVLSC